MITPHTKRIFLTPVSFDNLDILYKWRNCKSFMDNCTHRRESVSMETFRAELERDFAYDRHEQYLIHLRSPNRLPIGTIFSYGLNQVDGSVFVTTFLTDDHVGSGLGVEAFVLFGVYLMQRFSLLKIYTDVYEYNLLSLNTMLNWGFKEEGRFRQHRLFRGQRWDMIRLAVYATDLDRALKLGRKLGIAEQK